MARRVLFGTAGTLAGVAAIIGLGLFCLGADVASGATASGGVRLGYYTGNERSLEAVREFAPYLTAVSVDVFAVQPDGTILGEDELGAVVLAKSLGLRTYACVHNYNDDPAVNDFDPAWAHAAIVTHKEAVIDRLLSIAVDEGYDGVNVDIENLAFSSNLRTDRVSFTGFIHDLAQRLHAVGLELVISVPGKTNDSRDNDWTYPFDYASLGRDADYLQLMTYDQHGPWSEPGPVSGLPWVDRCVAYASELVDPAKLLIGLPAYGYDWDLSKSRPARGTYSATSFSWTEIPWLLAKSGASARWDGAESSPSLTYVQDGRSHEAWYENAESLREKTDLIRRYDLGGLAMWSLGQEDETFWQAIVGTIR